MYKINKEYLETNVIITDADRNELIASASEIVATLLSGAMYRKESILTDAPVKVPSINTCGRIYASAGKLWAKCGDIDQRIITVNREDEDDDDDDCISGIKDMIDALDIITSASNMAGYDQSHRDAIMIEYCARLAHFVLKGNN